MHRLPWRSQRSNSSRWLGLSLGAPVETEALHAFEEHLRNTANKPKRRIIEPVAAQVAAGELPVVDDQPIKVNPIAEKIMAAETAAITALDLANDDDDLGRGLMVTPTSTAC